MRHTAFLVLLSVAALIPGCRKEDTPVSTPTPSGPRLILKFAFDSTQVRLDELGQPEPTLPAGHAAQHPRFNAMSAHYVEFAPTAWTLPGQGSVVYHAPETSAGGDVAIDFAQSVLAGQGEVFLNVPLSTLTPGAYPWIRVSLGYQNYPIDFRYTDTVFGLGAMDLTGTVASFIGFNTYIGTFAVDQQTLTVNDDRPQGFWAFEVNDPLVPTPVISGQAPGTTVVNPLFATSPIPGNSCLVTGGFAQPLVITGQETEDVVITVSLSTNNSFEWIDNGDGHYEPLAGDLVVDMGIRGLIPIVE
ncbi:MAG: hypothetical protein IPJ87_10170 [Flavobacteriales bacterium]|jgi:hypothetical protein|nr:hypothetical protein [Flavobacteriales bacterium]MBK7942219.1 hypothetical protein [Flavobacteriales bacterium]MBK9701865.1 hypothetical protein [Flavobacteriales bacterium]